MSSRMLILTVLVAHVGCTGLPHGHSFGVQQASSNWGVPAEVSIPGIHTGVASKVKLMAGEPKGVEFVLWTDSENGLPGRGTGRHDHAIFECEYMGEDLSKHRIIAKTVDGKTGSLLIAGREYDLAEGRLFMVALGDGHLAVRQSTIAIDDLNVSGAELPKFADSHPEIAHFFAHAYELREEASEEPSSLDEEGESQVERAISSDGLARSGAE